MTLDAGEVDAALVDWLPGPDLGTDKANAKRSDLGGGKALDVDAVGEEDGRRWPCGSRHHPGTHHGVVGHGARSSLLSGGAVESKRAGESTGDGGQKDRPATHDEPPLVIER